VVTVAAWTNTQPTLEVNEKGVHAKLEGRLDFTVTMPNGETHNLFSTLCVSHEFETTLHLLGLNLFRNSMLLCLVLWRATN
jgi:hypothetical protein